jgi:haloacetate dehalogenase
MAFFDGFESQVHDIEGTRIHARTGGKGSPLLLLHGFPQTHAIWHRVARRLADRHFLVMPDLRGYGDSAKPPGAPDHANYSKRAMAADVLGLMRRLGHTRFSVAGHDRGGRVAHRLALDHPQAVERLAVLDIVPTLDMYDRTDMRFARHYYHWFHLIQPAPLPETMIGGDPAFYLRWTLGGWRTDERPPRSVPAPEGERVPAGGRAAGSAMACIEPEALTEYERCFCNPEAIHGACEDYRASAGIDLEHDRTSRQRNEKVMCDMLVLWGTRGVIQLLYEPLALWRAQCARRVQGRALECGHFIPEERPDDVADEFLAFFH